MLRIRDIKTIDPGPRQLTFGFDTITPEEKDALIMASFREEIAVHGHIFLTDLVSSVVEKHSLSEQDILQSIFWAANELKLHFMIDDSAISPHEARNILLKAPAATMILIDNQKVEDSVYQDALSFYQALMPEKIIEAGEEQYKFAIALRSIFTDWEAALKDIEPHTRKPFFPGSQKIEKHLQFLKGLMAHQDTASIINNAYNKREAIGEIKTELEILSQFYGQYAGLWESFIRLSEDLSPHLAELKQTPEALQDYYEFIRILESTAPWDMILEAERLYENLENHKNRIIKAKLRQKRIEAQADIQVIIEEVTQFLDTQKSDMDFRNQCLYPLQEGLSQVEKKGSLNALDDLVSHLEDMAEDILENRTG
jgi:hypothetical protein